MNNVDMFICTHRDFRIYPTNKAYKIICEKDDLIDVYPLNIIYEGHTKYSPLQKSLCELSRIYWIWKVYYMENNFMGCYTTRESYENDYIGLCHYSRYFDEFFDDVSSIPKKFEKSSNLSVMTLKKYEWNMREQYDLCHFIDDYDLMVDIICKKLNINKESFKKYEDFLYPCNMFIMKRTHFYRYCEFLFYVIDEFIKTRHFKTMNDIDIYVERQIKLKAERDNENLTEEDLEEGIQIQRRLLGFLGERISSFWFQYSFNNIIPLALKETKDY